MSYDLPAKFEEFSEARRQGFLRVKQVKENGGKVAGIFCTFTPTEILDAAGFISVSLCGSDAIILRVSPPNFATIFLAVASRTPLTMPEER